MSIRIVALVFALSAVACARPAARVASKLVPAAEAPPAVAAQVAEPTCTDGDLVTCTRACMQNNVVSACMTLGRMLIASENRGFAFEALSRACELGQACGCSYAGSAMLTGTGTKKAPAKAVEVLRKACDGGCESGCTSLGVAYEQGTGVDKDAARAASYYTRACELGSARGCGYLGAAYFEGAGVRRDEEQGMSLLRRACEDDDTWSCDLMAAIKEKSVTVPAPSTTL